MDGGNPRIFTAVAKEVISGGTWVAISGNTVVGSDSSTFQTSDLVAEKATVFGLVNGIAVQNTGSNKLVPIATRGMYLMKSAGAVSGGQLVSMSSGGSYDAVAPIFGVDAGSVVQGYVGRCIVGAGSEDYCVVDLNL